MTVLIQSLRAALGESGILTAPADRAPFETDWRRTHHHASVGVALPETAAQVSAVCKICAAAGVAVVPQGGNTSLVAGGVPIAGVPQLVLNLRRMNKTIALDPVGDTITVQAGVTVQAVQEQAAAAAKLFPVSFGAEGTAQIGGAIATNAGGIQVLAYGSMRAAVLGLQVVLADGRVWDGLRALPKDNTGFDLKQVFIGGEGALGIITAAVLKLFPAIRSQATALIGVGSVAAAVAVFQALREQAGHGALTMCEFIARPAMELAAAHGAGARLPFVAHGYVLAELSAHAADAPLARLLEDTLAPLLASGIAGDAVVAQSARERGQLRRLREAVPEAELAQGGAIKHDISVPIPAIAPALREIEAAAARHFADCRLNVFGHLGDGNLHVNLRPPPGATVQNLAGRQAAITAMVEAIAVSHGGSFSAEHGIGQMRLAGMATHKSRLELDLMRALKQAFDPAGGLNPGKVVPLDV